MLICILGISNSGKSTIARYLKEAYGIKEVVSYTTRPPRQGEIDGREHYFIDEAKMDALLESGETFAYTYDDKTNVSYCALVKDVASSDDLVYIINPDGIEYIENHNSTVDYKVIYVDVSYEVAISRGLFRGDDIKVLQTRLKSELAEFELYKSEGLYDYYIDGTKSVKEVQSEVDNIIKSIKGTIDNN